MTGSASFWGRWRAQVLRCLTAPALVTLAVGADPTPPRPAASANKNSLPAPNGLALPAPVYTSTLPPLDLASCRQLALERQPAIAAARASLAVAHTRLRALDNLRVPSFLARDLPIRKQQAAIGIQVNEAAVQVAENNTIFAVTYCYLAALYATQQQKVAEEALAKLGELRNTIAEYVADKESRKISPRDRALVDAYIQSTRARLQEATQGRERALSGLREALGVGPSCKIELARDRLFDVNPILIREPLLQLACERRPELVQALHGVEVTNLEAHAQGVCRLFPSVPTFASGSDLHAQPLPAGSYGMTYSPAVVGPEMPGTFNGPRSDRVEMAHLYATRAGSVLEKTRNLILLETEQAYLVYVEQSKKAELYRAAVGRGNKAAELARAAFETELKNPKVVTASVQPVLDSGLFAVRLRLDLNEARYQSLLALAILERATAGGFDAAFEVPTAQPAQDENNGNGSKDNNGGKEKNGDRGAGKGPPLG